MKQDEEQKEDRSYRDRYNDHEVVQRALNIVARAPPFHVIASGKVHSLVYLLLQLLYIATQVAVLHIDADNDAALSHAAIDQCRPLYHLYCGQVLQRHAGTVRGTDLQVPDVLNAVSQIFRKPHHAGESALT